MDYNMHFICTKQEAKEIIKAQKEFWISDCGCRAGRDKGCSRSKIEVCLGFSPEVTSTDSGVKKASFEEAMQLVLYAEEKSLVFRPYRDMEDKEKIDGICFCCDDCCGYFVDEDEPCDKGRFIEHTQLELCSHCGVCVPVCHFHAREIIAEKLKITQDNCYGCGLCFEVCPSDAISLVKR